ncbi:LytTR family DNA-binding domain-containing protein [Caulobacter segnis]|uniref:LytTR family DNA-binding domain-containing protein n=1 Tax=Caulobacter segnis TaxID=88688 RepID=UPI00240F8447|nr:LytTR family DNA-binding domain-containing protein [Caulobacter segnis]MDG2520890.1 LytTR family DNA-binding domain-containing protein [Caulobacter segnis]
MASIPASDLNSPRIWAIDLGVCAGVGVVMGLIGPFGSYFNDVVLVRIGYWVGSFLLSGVSFGLLLRGLWPMMSRARIPMWIWIPAVVVIATAPLCTLVKAFATTLWPAIARISWVEWYGQSVLIGLVYVLAYAFLRLRVADPAPAKPQAPPSEPAFLRRLPPRLGRDLLCLQMEDHYVRMHTTQGSDLVLLSLGQAMGELGGLEGMQVHRSWWVARHAVVKVIEDGRNLRLKLINGVEAPVSRASVAKLRAAGWIAL